MGRTLLAMAVLIAAGSSPASAQKVPHGPVFVDFNGTEQLAAELVRVGMLKQVLTYTLDVDAEGKPTKCELKRKFRRKYVEFAVCRPLLKHHKFEPARDADGNPIGGQYVSTIRYNSLLRSDGSRNDRQQ